MINIKKDITIFGVFNILIYIFVSFLLLPFLQVYFKINISLLNYVVWYVLSFGYTLWSLYILNKDAEKRSHMEIVTYNWFTKGGLSSYQDMFLLSEKEPLYEYGMLGFLVLIPVANKLTMRRKLEVIVMKVGIFHMISSFLLMDWSNLVVNYEFRDVESN